MTPPESDSHVGDPDEVPASPPGQTLGAGTDVTADPTELDEGDKPATSNAQEYREHGQTMGGTGGLDAGGAG